MKWLFVWYVSLFVIQACSSSRSGLFASKTPHEKYTDQITGAGLGTTALGQAWLQAANKSLLKPLTVTVPYRETGYFNGAKPSGAGYRFQARKGEQLIIELDKKPLAGFTIFMELWRMPENEQSSLVQSVDTSIIQEEIKDDGFYHVRLQPELLAGGEYTLTIRSAPSLAFPVPSQSNPRIGSFWGDARDAGSRNHEGIDIFGSLRTPVVAAADGHINTVGTNNLGGKIIFLRPSDKKYSLYYAHLDSQLVREGQRVSKGEIIGLMGKTGNARNTPVHLHFGIYTNQGAVDPFPFVNPDQKDPAAITVSQKVLNKLARSKKNATIYIAPQKNAVALSSPAANTLLEVIAAAASWYKVRMPDSSEGFIAGTGITELSKIQTLTIAASKPLLDRPDSTAAAKTIIQNGKQVDVLAFYNDFYYIETGDGNGWIKK